MHGLPTTVNAMTTFKIATICQYAAPIAFIILIVLSPSILFIPYIEFHDSQRVMQLVLLSLVLIDSFFLGWGKTETITINNKIQLGGFAILTLAIVSAFLSQMPRYAIIEITIFAALCYFALFVARFFNQNKEVFIKQLTYALWASIVLYMVSFYVGYTTAMVFKKTLVWPYPFYGFSNIRLFQQYQLWSLGIICLPLLAFDLAKRIRFWLYGALTGWWILLFYAASRGALLGWLVAVLITAIMHRKSAWPFLRIQLINALTGLGGYLILFKAIPNWVADTAASPAIVTSTVFRDTVSDRTDLWNAAFEMIKTHPVLGVGPMHFYFYNSFGTHPHNSVLQLAAEWGLPATFIILAIAGYGFHCWYKKLNADKLEAATKLDSNLSMILFFTIITNGAYSLVDGVIVMPISQVLMFTMIGLMIGQYTEGNWLVTNQSIKRKLRFRPIFAGVVLVFMVLSTLPELVRGLTSYDRYFVPGERAFSMAPDTINPRIWMQQRRIEPEANKPRNNKEVN